MEKLGVSAITLHPRTTKQQFSGTSDWSLIKELNTDSITADRKVVLQPLVDYIQEKTNAGVPLRT